MGKLFFVIYFQRTLFELAIYKIKFNPVFFRSIFLSFTRHLKKPRKPFQSQQIPPTPWLSKKQFLVDVTVSTYRITHRTSVSKFESLRGVQETAWKQVLETQTSRCSFYSSLFIQLKCQIVQAASCSGSDCTTLLELNKQRSVNVNRLTG